MSAASGASALAASASETASKFAGFASKTFSRAVQFSQEKMGAAEKTELDYRFQQLSERADKTKTSTEKMVKSVELYLEPSTGVRLQNFVNSKLNRPRTSKETHLERVGAVMIESGEALGSDEQYGGALIRAGIVQQHVGEAWAELAAATTTKFLEPKSHFLNVDSKELARLRTKLSRARLDLDAAKTKARKAQTGPAEKLAEAESQLRSAQWEFDEQYKQVKAALESVTEEHEQQLGQLVDYVEAQYEYFQNATKLMGDLVKDLRALRPPSFSPVSGLSQAPAPSATSVSLSAPSNGFTATSAARSAGSSIVGRKARVVYDHEANNDSELSVSADDIVTVLGEPTNVNGVNLCLCEVRGSKGLVPHAFLQWEN